MSRDALPNPFSAGRRRTATGSGVIAGTPSSVVGYVRQR